MCVWCGEGNNELCCVVQIVRVSKHRVVIMHSKGFLDDPTPIALSPSFGWGGGGGGGGGGGENLFPPWQGLP